MAEFIPNPSGGGAGASTFLALTDVPSSYVGQGLKVVRVNAGATGLEFVAAAGGGDMLAATYDPAGIVQQVVGTTAVQTVTNKTFTSPKITNNDYIADENGNQQIMFSTTASAINEFTVANAATGNSPTITMSGGDANIGFNLTMKGTGLFTKSELGEVITQRVATTGNPTAYLLTTGLHTTLTSGEVTHVNLDFSNAIQINTGAIANFRLMRIQGGTINFVGASVVTRMATVEISATTAGANATFTNNYALGLLGALEINTNSANSIVFANTAKLKVTTANAGITLEGNKSAATTGTTNADVVVGTSVTRTGGSIFSVLNNAGTKFTVGYQGSIALSPTAGTTGTIAMFTITNANHTAQTASTQINNILSTAYTRTWSTGALAEQNEVFIGIPTYAAVGASVFTQVATFTLEGAPAPGTNMTFTNTALSLWVKSGTVRVDAPFIAQGTTAIPAGGTAGVGIFFSSTANFGFIFGSGAPTATAALGTLYLRSNGSGINNRLYVNTDGGTTWTNFVTAA